MTDNLLAGGQTDDLPAIDSSKNYLTELVGEGKKFKSPEELARGKYQADLYIDTIVKQKEELRQDYLKLREEYTARAKLEELINQMSTKQQQSGDSTQKANDVLDQPVYDPKQIESLVSSKIQEHELSKRQQENFNQVKGKLIERFGTNYQNVVKQQIDSLGLTEEDFNKLARSAPAALFKTLGLDAKVQEDSFQAPPRSDRRNSNFSPMNEKRTWAWYQNLKKSDPRKYLDPKTQVQMHKDYEQLGSNFEDGDFNAQ